MIEKKIFSDHSIYIWLLLIPLIFFSDNISGTQYVKWDTHDGHFKYFLFFSDSLKSGYFPFLNHLEQSGYYFPSFARMGYYTPFEFFFIILSFFLNPLISYEIMLQTILYIGGLGAYFYILFLTKDIHVSILAAITYVLLIMMQIIGQETMIFALSIFPWLFVIYHKYILDQTKSNLFLLLLGSLIGTYFVSGYAWIIFINLTIFFIYSVISIQNRPMYMSVYTILSRVLLFLFSACLVYTLFLLPGILDMYENYHLFNGEYISPDPRLRSLGVQPPVLLYDHLFYSIIGSVEPMLMGDNFPISGFPDWSRGIGLVIFSIFLTTIFKKTNTSTIDRLWIAIIIFFLLYSCAAWSKLYDLITEIPILGSNRWYGIGIFYVAIAFLFLTSTRIAKFEKSNETKNLKFLIIFYVIFTCFLIYVFLINNAHPKLLFFFILPFFIFLLLPKYKTFLFSSLIFITMYYVYNTNNSDNFNRAHRDYSQYFAQIASRTQSIVIEKNERVIENSKYYQYDNIKPLLQKHLSSGGFNHLGDPFYWYFKSTPIVEKVIYATKNVKKEDSCVRNMFKDDNIYATICTNQVIQKFPATTIDVKDFQPIKNDEPLKYAISSFSFTPNQLSLNIKINSAAYVVFSTPFDHKWRAYLDNKQTEIIKANHSFMSIFLPSEGQYTLKFVFNDVFAKTIIVLIYSFIALLLILFLKEKKGSYVFKILDTFIKTRS